MSPHMSEKLASWGQGEDGHDAQYIFIYFFVILR